MKTLEKHSDLQNQPKRILFLDGGGVLTLSYLKHIEDLLTHSEDDLKNLEGVGQSKESR